MAASKEVEKMKKAELVKEVMRLKSVLGKRDSYIKTAKETLVGYKEQIARQKAMIEANRHGCDGCERFEKPVSATEELFTVCEECDWVCCAERSDEPTVCMHDDIVFSVKYKDGRTVDDDPEDPPLWCPMRTENKKDKIDEQPQCCDLCRYGRWQRGGWCENPTIMKYFKQGRDIDIKTSQFEHGPPPLWCPRDTEAVINEEEYKQAAYQQLLDSLPNHCNDCEFGRKVPNGGFDCTHSDIVANMGHFIDVGDPDGRGVASWCPLREAAKEQKPADKKLKPSLTKIICHDCDIAVHDVLAGPGGYVVIEGDHVCADCAISRAKSLLEAATTMKESAPHYEKHQAVSFPTPRDQNGSSGELHGFIRGDAVRDKKGGWVYPVVITLGEYSESDICLMVSESVMQLRIPKK